MKRKIVLVESVLLALALVVYLGLIARQLRAAARTLRLVSVGLRAIETQTRVIEPSVAELNENLDHASGLLEAAVRPSGRGA